MIRIVSANGEPVRVLAGEAPVEFHARYGFVSAGALAQRRGLRRRVGAYAPEHAPLFSFDFHGRQQACTLTKESSRWRLESAAGDLYFLEPVTPSGHELELLPPPPRSKLPLLVLIAAFFLPFALLNWMTTPQIEKKSKSPDQAPVVLHAPTPVPVKESTPAPDPQTKARRVVTQQLGFLGLLGKKNFKKAVGGLPTPTQAQTSAGAGEGTQGSGGELIAGMGRGLHQTTVGNSGVSGLGGLGTKGAGGGQGAYGDTAFGGNGGGQTLSAIPLAQDAQVDEGLDRSQIQSTILRYLSQVRACYEDGLKRNQALIGQVTMAFEVGPQGQVNAANIQRSSLGDRAVESCIQTKMMTWKFPQPRGGTAVKVSFPFMLRPVRS